MNDQPVLQSPGDKLAGLREKTGRTLENVAEATKIPPAMLQAIELDEYHKISGELYVKSFLRSYAEEMGLEVEEILRLYGNFMGEAAGPSVADNSTVWQEEEVEIKRLGLPWGTIGVIAGVAIVILVVVFYFMQKSGDDENPAASGETVEVIDATEDQDPVPVESAAADPTLTPGEQLVTGSDVGLAGTVEDLIEALPADPDQLRVAGQSWPVIMRLICPQEVEISMKRDGQRSFEAVDWSQAERALDGQSIAQGTAYKSRQGWVVYWGAEDHFSLMVNNPEGIRASLNGEFRDISGLGPGQEIILNDPAVIRSNLPSAQNTERP